MIVSFISAPKSSCMGVFKGKILGIFKKDIFKSIHEDSGLRCRFEFDAGDEGDVSSLTLAVFLGQQQL